MKYLILIVLVAIVVASTPSCTEDDDILYIIPIDSMDHSHCTDTIIDDDYSITFVP